MKPIKALLVLGALVAAIVAVVVYLPKPEAAAPDTTVQQTPPADAAPAGKGGKKAEDAPRLEEKYGVAGPGVPGM
jgi:hypothetical protein